MQDAKNLQKSQSTHHRTTLSGNIFATKTCIDNRKKLVKQQYLLHISAQYAKLRPSNGWDLFTSLGHPSKFQRVSRLAFVTAVTSLTGGQLNFVWCLAISCAGALYIHFWELLPPDGILPGAEFILHQSLAFSYGGLLAALLHGTPAAGVSRTLLRGTRNGITELSQWRHLYLGG